MTPDPAVAPTEPATSPVKARSSIAVRMLFGFFSWVLPGILVFFSTPILVRALGKADYGIYVLIFGFISYSLGFSLSKAVTKYVAEYKPAGEHEKISEVISATFLLSFAVGAAAALLFSGGAGWLIRNAFQIAPEAQEKSIQAFYIAAMFLLCYMLWQVFASLLTGLHRFDYYSYVTIAYGVLLSGGNILLAWMGYGLLGLFWWSLATNVIITLLAYAFAKSLYPQMRLKFGFRRETLRLVMRYNSGVVLTQIFANVLLLFERGLITRALGSETLTYYVVPMTLAIYIQSFIGSFTMVLFPITSELGGQRDKQIVLYKRASKVVVTLVVFIAVTMIAAGHSFLTKWVGIDIAEHSAPILTVHVIVFSLFAIVSIVWQLADGLGHPEYNAWLSLIWLVFGAGAMLALVTPMGGVGVAIGRLAGMSVVPLAIMYAEHWLLGGIQWAFWTRLLLVLALAAALTWLAVTLILGYLPLSWLGLLAAGAGGALIYASVLLATGWYTQDERLLINRLLLREKTV